MFGEVYANKKVLVTGNTGFKGTWLTLWLELLGAKVYGISKDLPTSPSMFDRLKIENKIQHHWADIRDLEVTKKIILDIQPDFVFHLAAQAIVSKSYEDPLDTFTTNAIGTANILEALRYLEKNCTAILITSDKCYENIEQNIGYKESDHLGGKDPYSASKGASEIFIHGYFHSFFRHPDATVKMVSVRAGNIIGGGDWGENRLVPDCMRAWSSGNAVEIRNPSSIRPWQHVLEPLSGYLRAGEALTNDGKINGQAYNFGPPDARENTVSQLLDNLQSNWQFDFEGKKVNYSVEKTFYEAGILKLNCEKALDELKWVSVLSLEETTKFTAFWYQAYYSDNTDLHTLTQEQINQYVSLAVAKGLPWT